MLRSASVCFVALAFLASCGGESPPEAGDRVEIDAPSGWKPFDQGVVAGAVPKSWSVRVISGEEFKLLSAKAISSQEIFNESVRESVEKLDPEDLSGSVLLAVAPSGFPNINLQLCSPSLIPALTSEPELLVAMYERTLKVEASIVGEVTFEGDEFALVEVHPEKGPVIYQSVVGSAQCASIATFTNQQTREFEDFQTFMSVLEITTD